VKVQELEEIKDRIVIKPPFIFGKKNRKKGEERVVVTFY